LNATIPTRAELLADPSVSHWLKDALRASAKRDILDALNDANTLQLVLQDDWNKMKMEEV
jgi:hypothetical protein